VTLAEKRIQIYLPETLFGALKREARAENKSIAQVIREAIENHLEERRRRKINWENDPLNKIIGMGSSKVRDASSHHDKYIYASRLGSSPD